MNSDIVERQKEIFDKWRLLELSIHSFKSLVQNPLTDREYFDSTSIRAMLNDLDELDTQFKNLYSELVVSTRKVLNDALMSMELENHPDDSI